MSKRVPITVAHGDGIGPEIMSACLHIIQEAGAAIDFEKIDVGEQVYLQGHTSGMGPESWESLRRTKVFYKAPITTPQGGGYKSLNVTTRKTLGLYANIRPCTSYHPYIDSLHPKMDVVIVRENEEDLYAGIEHRQTAEVYQCLKLISRPGSEKIVRYAFEYARKHNRKKVTCFAKDNIMKLTDGLFHQVFDEIAADYSDLENEFWIVDIGAAKLADTPENFDVIVLPNMYGDILSDVSAQIAGSVGLAGSANVGDEHAMFEAIHGSAPRRAGQNLANPSGLLMGGLQMLVHIGQAEVAERIHNAWLCTIENGIHTYDVYNEAFSTEKVGTKEFAEAVVARLGKIPEKLTPVSYASSAAEEVKSGAIRLKVLPKPKKEMVGVDVFLDWDEDGRDPNKLGETLSQCNGDGLSLAMISNRGQKIWPDGAPETFRTDHWRCRFQTANGAITHTQVAALLQRVADAGFDFIKTEGLFTFDGEPGFSKGQGQ